VSSVKHKKNGGHEIFIPRWASILVLGGSKERDIHDTCKEQIRDRLFQCVREFKLWAPADNTKTIW
jgi:hypothetical protein